MPKRVRHDEQFFPFYLKFLFSIYKIKIQAGAKTKKVLAEIGKTKTVRPDLDNANVGICKKAFMHFLKN